MAECCENCRFWVQGSATSCVGECRRRSPLPIMHEQALPESHEVAQNWWTVWPNTAPGEWCGEYEPKRTSL